MLVIAFLINLVRLQYSAFLTNSVNGSSTGIKGQSSNSQHPFALTSMLLAVVPEATWLVRVYRHETATHSCPCAVLVIRLKRIAECRLGQTHRLILAGRCCPVMGV